MNKQKSTTPNSPLSGYIAGFILSVALTIGAYIIARDQLFEGWTLVYIILILAITQLMVQVVFFLHIMEEKKPRFNLMAFNFMVMVIAIIVVGSIWIMKNLDYNMMPDKQKEILLEDSNIQTESYQPSQKTEIKNKKDY